MPAARPPWWMYIVAAAFLGFIALFAYEMFWGPPILPGFEGSFRSGGLVVLAVHPDSVEERAGLRAGDRVLAVDGQVIRNAHDREAIRANTEIGRPERWEISRANERLQLTLTFPRPSGREMLSAYGRAGPGFLLFILTSLVLGLIVAFRRPYDPVAKMGAWVLVTASVAFGLPDGWAATWRQLPGVLGLLLWIPEISRFVPDAILFTFFTIFPRRIFRPRWPWLLIWMPALALLPWRAFAAYQVIYQPGHATDAPEWVVPAISVRSVVYVLGSLVLLVLSYRRLEDANQRRRARVVLAGLVISTLGVTGWVVTGAGRGLSFWHQVLQAVLFMLWLAFPVSFAYAVLRHRLFDVGVLIRQGLQYAVARGALLSLVPLLVAAMFGDALLHGERPLLEILRARGWVYGGVGALALVAHARRQRWLSALDRRFFREHYDAQLLLREIAEEARQAGNLERAAPRVVARVEAALHPQFAAVMVRPPDEASFQALASAPSGHAPPPLSAETRLMGLVRILGKPLEMPHSESGWLERQLPHEETDFLRRAEIDLIVPIAVTPQPTEALMALGVKRSEEPYTREDQDLLSAIAASLAGLLEKPAEVSPRVREAFEECPQCGACYDSGAGLCTQEGSSLNSVRLPRQLVGRYRLERRRGRGGMGTVYEATDTALDRRVAVKVIRENLVGSRKAAEQFRWEARATASFAHPNVVTVFDFGVAADTHAFLVMELLDGSTLREELLQKKRLGAARTLEILSGVCAAVEAAHRRKLIHRDLKPENVYLARNESGEVVKVLDFGIAKFLPAATESTAATADTGKGVLMGTLPYMSPEQLCDEPVQPAWDIWALTVIAYEMLTGARPFSGGAMLSGPATPVSTYMPDAPASLQIFFDHALALDPSTRPRSAPILFSELKQALS